MLHQVFQGSGPHGVHGGAAADILIRFHAGLAAQGHNVADPLTLCGHGLAGVRGSGGGRGSGRGAGTTLAASRGRISALGGIFYAALATGRGAAGRLTALAVVRFVDLALQLVKFGLLLRRQVTASGAGAVDNFLLAGNPLFLVLHGFSYLQCLFLLIWICRS